MPELASAIAVQSPNGYRRKRINYALAATLIASGISLEDAAKQTGAKNANVLAVGLRRHGVTAQQARNLPISACKTHSIAIQVATEASSLLKDKFSNALDKHADAITKLPAKANAKHLAQVGQAMEPFVRMAKIVHGWGDESVSGLISIGVVEQLQRPGCGVEATTSGVPAKQIEDNTPQLPQVIDIEGQAS